MNVLLELNFELGDRHNFIQKNPTIMLRYRAELFYNHAEISYNQHVCHSQQSLTSKYGPIRGTDITISAPWSCKMVASNHEKHFALLTIYNISFDNL